MGLVTTKCPSYQWYSSLINICSMDSFRISIRFVDIIVLMSHLWSQLHSLPRSSWLLSGDFITHGQNKDRAIKSSETHSMIYRWPRPTTEILIRKTNVDCRRAKSINLDIKPVFIAVWSSFVYILCCKNNSGKLSPEHAHSILKISTANYGLLWLWTWWWSRYKLMLRWWELGCGVTLGDVIKRTGNIPGPSPGCDMVITSWAGGDTVTR